MGAYDCELVLKRGAEKRQPHTFPGEVRPGTIVHLDGAAWVVVEVNERIGRRPEVVARPVAERR